MDLSTESGTFAPNSSTRSGALNELARLARRAGAQSIARQAEELTQRVEEGRFFVACVGQHKRGKSTILNALIGAPVFPTGVVPATSIVTVVRHGPAHRVRVRLNEIEWHEIEPAHLADYVTEERNPQNVRCVSGVEVYLPHRLLESGMCLVDTPGIGSVFAQNTATTRAMVPHIDAAIVVLGVDPPISGDEIELVHEMAGHVSPMLFVINKVDRISEEHLEQACRFTEQVVTGRLRRPPGRIYRVSATERLAGAGSAEWDALVAAIEAVDRGSGADLVRDAGSRGLLRVVSLLQHELSERRDALLWPIAESERRLESLNACLRDATEALGDLGHLLRAEHERLSIKLRSVQHAFLDRALPDAREELARRLRDRSAQRPSTLRRDAVRQARDVARAYLDRLRFEVAEEGETLYRKATTRFAEHARVFMVRLAESGEPALARRHDDVEFDLRVRVQPRAHEAEMLPLATPSPLRWLVEAVLPGIALRSSTRRFADRYLAALLGTNAARVVNDFDDRARESRRRLEVEIRQHIGESSAAAERALIIARARSAIGEDAVRGELEKIEILSRDLRAVLTATPAADGKPEGKESP